MTASQQLKGLLAGIATVGLIGAAMAQGTPMGTTGTPGGSGSGSTGSTASGGSTSGGSTSAGTSGSGSTGGSSMGSSSTASSTMADSTGGTRSSRRARADRN